MLNYLVLGLYHRVRFEIYEMMRQNILMIKVCLLLIFGQNQVTLLLI